ncbi:MAG TPA: hypothetical protein VK474_11040, partial [Chthoniobacterales bacterium]|nr:hypothetical protein [Chthoniobacterales bacterium]
MEKHTLIYTALPNGRAADGSLRLSVFIAPRLWSDNAAVEKLKLAQFPDFLDWPTRVQAATWQVSFDGAPALSATVESDVPRADVWSALFTGETDVVPFRFDDYRGSIIETFSSTAINDFLAGVYARAASDPAYGAGLHLPSIGVLARDPDIGGIARPSAPEPPFVPPPRPAPIDLGGTLPPPDPAPAPAPDDGTPGGCGCSGCGCLLLPLAILVRLFPFLKPFFDWLFRGGGSSAANAAKPVMPIEPKPTLPPDAPPNPPSGTGPRPPAAPLVPESPAKKEFDQVAGFVTPPSEASQPLPTAAEIEEQYDFHQAIAALGDYPKLLRILGLVVDLRIELNGAAPAATGTVKVAPGIAFNGVGTEVTPRTHYDLAAGIFLARSRPVGSEISHGLLRLNDEARFRVIQVEPVGGAIKMQNAATNIAAWPEKEDRAPNSPDDGGLPALRTGGISLVRQDLLEETRERFLRSHALQRMVFALDNAPQPPEPPAAEPPAPATDELFAEDLVRGYRVDVFDSKSNAWHSLGQRIGHYNFLENPALLPSPIEDEGFVQFSATEPASKPAQRTFRTSDSLFVWDGWSLCAPRPGQSVLNSEPGDPLEKVRLGKPKNEAVTKFKLEVNFEAKPRSLPRLRFGYSYRLRARVCDLAGNSAYDPAAPEFAADVAEQTSDFPCVRYEPVAPPAMMLRAAPVEGESLERLVVRTDPAVAGSATTERHIIPPKISQLMAEQHGKFDGVQMDGTSAGYDRAKREGAALDDDATEVKPHIWIFDQPQFPLKYLPDPSARGA